MLARMACVLTGGDADLLKWLLYAFAAFMVGKTLYTLVSGESVSTRYFFTWKRDSEPRAYWFGFAVDLGLTILVCYLAFDIAFGKE